MSIFCDYIVHTILRAMFPKHRTRSAVVLGIFSLSNIVKVILALGGMAEWEAGRVRFRRFGQIMLERKTERERERGIYNIEYRI